MQEMDDNALLGDYLERGSEEAFATLVARHVNIVYSVALRHARNPHQAEEITQAVFVLLARKARRLGRGVILSGWLHRAARLTAATTIRGEIRRARREQEAHMQNISNQELEPSPWPQIAPLLDTALDGLSEPDRHAVVLRFLDGRTMNEVGRALGASEDAAKKRVSRALEKLRSYFVKRGVVVSSTALAAAISSHAVQAAPIGLATTATHLALASGAKTGLPILALLKGLLKPAVGAVGGVLVALLGSFYFLLRAEVESGKSQRERQFLKRMIWLRFGTAALGTALPLLLLLAKPDLVHQPGVLEYGFAGYFFIAAVECAVRTVYFHRRRRQIQIEEGTWEAFDQGPKTRPGQLLGDLMGASSKADRSAAFSAVLGLCASLLLAPILMNRLMEGGHWIGLVLFLGWVGYASFRSLRNWRRNARRVFDPGFGRLAKVILSCAAMSLVFFNLSWARGRMIVASPWAIAFNLLVLLAYAVLLWVLGRVHAGTESAPLSESRS